MQRLEAIPYDIRLRLSLPTKVNNTPPIVIIDIDELSLKNEGRWPWSRKKLATLVDKLYANNVSLIALDIVHSEPELNPAESVKQALTKSNIPVPDWYNSIAKTLDADSIFANTIKDKEIVLGYPFHKTLLTQSGKLAKSSFKTELTDTESLTVIEMLGYTANLNKFTSNAMGSGFISSTPDSDGVLRKTPIIALYNEQIYPSLALEIARIYLIEDAIELHTNTVGSTTTISHISLGKTHVKTDAKGQILIPYLGKPKHFPYYSATEILHASKLIPDLEGAITIIGTSAIALADLPTTPVQASFPGVEIQANIVHGILNPKSISYIPDWTKGAIIVLLTILGALMTLVYPKLQPATLLVTGSVLLFLSFAFNYWLWAYQRINLPIILPLLLIFSITGVYIIHGLLQESKARKRIHNMFGQYVPVEHINKLIDSPDQISTDGQKRVMTVLFSDLRNFTSLSEPLTTRELKDFLNRYLTPITKIIFDNEGTIDKYVGDMVMAFWGAPIKLPNHAHQAVISAFQMQTKITAMQDEFKQLGISEVAAGIGVHTGEMNVGDMGSDYRRAYTVLGDAVNLGSRLESLTKFYQVKILVSEDTKNQCPDIAFRYVDFVRVKGKKDAIKIYEPLMEKRKLTEQQLLQLETHRHAFECYLKGEWQAAKNEFEKLHNDSNDFLYQLYIDRVSKLSSKDWDGVYTHRSK